MREDLLKEVGLEMEEIQRRNEETVQRRKREVLAAYPEIRALTEERETLVHSAFRQIMDGEITAAELPGKMEDLSGRIRAALKARGLPENYLEPVYDCPVCRDTGYTGETIRERCACVTKRYQKHLRRAIGLPEDSRETFEGYDESLFPDTPLPGSRMTERQAMARVRSYCEKWADTYPAQEPRDLVLTGKSGLGKTFLLHAMAQRLIERNASVLLLSAYSFLEIARRSWFEQDGGMDDLIGSEILMLDDLGSEPLMQNITIEQLFHLINERQRRGKATVISTNLSIEEIQGRYTERIASRLTDARSCLVLPLRGHDLRNGRQ